MNYKYKDLAASWVWIIPALILVYQFWNFRASSQQSHFAVAYHQYFSGRLELPEYSSYQDMFQRANLEILRAADQLRFTAPFFAGVGYSMGGFVSGSMRVDVGH